MDSLPREVLRELLERYGRDLATDRRRLRGLLLDDCGTCRAEVTLLVQAQEARVPEMLLQRSPMLSPGVLVAQLRDHLETTYFTAPVAASWAVEIWALALGMTLPPPPVAVPPVSKSAPSVSQTTLPPAALPVATPASADRRRNPVDGKEQVRIPAGEFLYGDKKERRSLPEYWIDVAPVTQAEYHRFIQAHPDHRVPYVDENWAKSYNWDRERRTPPAGKGQHPVVLVSHDDAEAYCRWAGKRLPMEEEWEKAARGTDGREYPWGDKKPTRDLCNFERNEGGTTSVGKYSPRGDSPYGCVDMAGNVWEWSGSWYADIHISRVLRGGGWYNGWGNLRVANRNISYVPSYRGGNIGFRCAGGAPGI